MLFPQKTMDIKLARDGLRERLMIHDRPRISWNLIVS